MTQATNTLPKDEASWLLGLVLSIFNEIDEDGNQSLDQKEMFEFIKKQEFKEPNAPATLQKKKTLT